jgi:hypothetical protein
VFGGGAVLPRLSLEPPPPTGHAISPLLNGIFLLHQLTRMRATRVGAMGSENSVQNYRQEGSQPRIQTSTASRSCVTTTTAVGKVTQGKHVALVPKHGAHERSCVNGDPVHLRLLLSCLPRRVSLASKLNWERLL